MNPQSETTPSEPKPACADLEAIAAHAYAIWQEQGCPGGRDFDHWIEAEAHLLRGYGNDARKQEQ